MSIFVSARGLERTLGAIDRVANSAARATYRAVNKVASKAFTRSKREITSRVNLTSAYLNKPDYTGAPRLEIIKATSAKPVAIIRARKRGTRLATYGAKQLVRKADKKRIAASGKKLWGVNAGAGDTRRGIPKGSVPAGVSVKVLRGGQRKRMRSAFFMPLKNSNGMGVFIRTGVGRKAMKHLYSLSVDQVFRRVIDDIKDDVARDLSETLAKQVAFEFRGYNK